MEKLITVQILTQKGSKVQEEELMFNETGLDILDNREIEHGKLFVSKYTPKYTTINLNYGVVRDIFQLFTDELKFDFEYDRDDAQLLKPIRNLLSTLIDIKVYNKNDKQRDIVDKDLETSFDAVFEVIKSLQSYKELEEEEYWTNISQLKDVLTIFEQELEIMDTAIKFLEEGIVY